MQKAAEHCFLYGQMDGNSIALDYTANDCRRGAKKMTKLRFNTIWLVWWRKKLKYVFFSLSGSLRAWRRSSTMSRQPQLDAAKSSLALPGYSIVS